MQREKVDFLVAMGEKLCNLDSSNEMQKLEGLTDASSKTKTEKNHAWDGGDGATADSATNNQTPEEFLDMVAEMVRYIKIN